MASSKSDPTTTTTMTASERRQQSTWQFFKGLTRVHWLTLGILGLAQLCLSVTFSCIVPFFPSEANHKGLSTTQVGLLIGVFQLVVFLASPVIGKFMTQLGPKRLFTGGLFIGGLGSILFGLLRALPSGPPFFWAGMLIRSVKALGSACYATGSLTIVAQSFPGKVATVMSLMEICTGIGYMGGPLLGSVLYELGGFPLPFFVLGSLMLISSLISLLSLLRGRRAVIGEKSAELEKVEKAGNEATAKGGREGSWKLLAIPELWLTCWATLTMEISCFFYDASIGDHLADLNGGPMMVGLMISLVSGTYLLSAPFCGMLIDKRPGAGGWAMLAGSLFTALAILIMGPSPWLPLQKSIPSISTSFALLGLAISPLYIPTFQHCINAARERGFSESDAANCGLISGMLQAAASLGAFLGASLGGASVSLIGFAWTTTVIAGLHIAWSSAQAIYCVHRAFFSRRRMPSSSSSSPTGSISSHC